MKAFAQIKVRFALLCVLLSGAVLLAACLLGWQNTRRQAQDGFQEQLAAQFSAMENQLRTVNVVSELALCRFETENEVWISLYDNGRPVGFRNHPGGQARAALLDSAQKQGTGPCPTPRRAPPSPWLVRTAPNTRFGLPISARRPAPGAGC